MSIFDWKSLYLAYALHLCKILSTFLLLWPSLPQVENVYHKLITFISTWLHLSQINYLCSCSATGFLSQNMDALALPSQQLQLQELWVSEKMLNDTVYIPSWWHNAITYVGQCFENAKEDRLALIYHSIAKKFVYAFVKNDRKRVIVACEHKKDKGCPWRLQASPLTHSMKLVIKTFNRVHTCGTGTGINGHKRAYKSG